MKRATWERLAAVLVLAACICAECIPLLLALVAAAALCVGGSQIPKRLRICQEKRPPVLQHQAVKGGKK